MDFAERLKQLRHESGRSQSEMAKIFGITKSSLSMYELGLRRPPQEVIETIADYFNIDLDYLMGRTDVRNRAPIGMDDLINPSDRAAIDDVMQDPKLLRLLDELSDLSDEQRARAIDSFLSLIQLSQDNQ